MATDLLGQRPSAANLGPRPLARVLYDEADRAGGEARAMLLAQAAAAQRQAERRERRNFMARLRYARRRDKPLPCPTLPGLAA